MTLIHPLLFAGGFITLVVLIGMTCKLVALRNLRGTSGAARTLFLKETIALDPRRRLHVVQCGQRQVVLLTGGGQDLVVGWTQDP